MGTSPYRDPTGTDPCPLLGFNCHVICLHVQCSTNVADGNEEVPKKWTEKLHGKSVEGVDLMLLPPSLRCVECNTVTFLPPANEVNALLASVILFTGEESPSGQRHPWTETPLDRNSLDRDLPLRETFLDRDPTWTETPWTETSL